MSSKNPKPNILMFFTDEHHIKTIGAYGSDVCRTPNIDRFARGALRFGNAFTISAVCGPARASMLTGQYLHRHGVVSNNDTSWSAGPKMISGPKIYDGYTQILKRAGYNLGYIGKWHISDITETGPPDYGYEGTDIRGYGAPYEYPGYRKYRKQLGLDARPNKVDRLRSRHAYGPRNVDLAARMDGPVEGSLPYYLAEETMRLLRKYAQDCKETGQPFFVRCDFWGPHFICFLPEPYYSLYDPHEIPDWDTWNDPFENKPGVQKVYKEAWGTGDFSLEEWKVYRAKYYGYVSLIDAAIGRVLEELEALGLHDSTFVVFTSDHGDMLGEHGLIDKGPFMYDDIYRIPMIIRWPGVVNPGVNGSFVYNIDLCPTFVELAGESPPDFMDATSLMGLLRNEPGYEERTEIVSQFYTQFHYCPQRMIRNRRYKYIFNFFDLDELYDLEQDAHEMRNLVSAPEHRQILNGLRRQLHQWILDNDDPILESFERTAYGK